MPMRRSPREAWVVAGVIEGQLALPKLAEPVAGLPHLLRIAGELALAGARDITVLWTAPGPIPDVSAIAGDPRLLHRATLTVATEPPGGPPDEPVLLVRADRIWHRDLAKQAVAAWRNGTGTLAKVAGDDIDAVVVAEGALAIELVACLRERGRYATRLHQLAAAGEVATAPLPERGFSDAAPDRAAVRRAERKLVWSLRKSADG